MSGGRLVEGTGTQALPAIKESRSFLMVHYVTYVGIIAHAGFIGMFAWMRVPVLALFNVFSVATWLIARRANNRLHPELAAWLITAEVIAHAVLACFLLGFSSGFAYYLVPLMPFLIFNDRLSTRLVAIGAVAIGGIYLALRFFTAEVVSPPLWAANVAWLEYVNIFVPFFALGLISVYFRLGSIDAEKRMEQLAMTDALTRLPNRRRMREMLEAERTRFARSGRPFAIVIGDLDGFKQINDTLGHDCGDHVLREVAAVMRLGLRGQDAVARWGGEEFLFLLPDTDIAGAGVLAERLRQAVEKAHISFKGDRLPITMTFGVSAYNRVAPAEECIRQADQALYAGKHQGKNRIMLGAA